MILLDLKPKTFIKKVACLRNQSFLILTFLSLFFMQHFKQFRNIKNNIFLESVVSFPLSKRFNLYQYVFIVGL